jgi:hypothetical protein
VLAIVNIYLLIDEYFNYSHSVSQSVSPHDKSREKHLSKYFDQNDESRHSNQAQLSITYYLRRNRSWCALKCLNTVLHKAWTNMVMLDTFFSRQSVDDCFGKGWPEAHNWN